MGKIELLEQKFRDECESNEKFKEDVKRLEQKINPTRPSKGILETITSHRAHHKQVKSQDLDENSPKLTEKLPPSNKNDNVQGEDAEEVLFDANNQDYIEESYRKAQNPVKQKFNIINQLPDLYSDELEQNDNDNEIIDLSSSLDNENNKSNEDLKPLPSRSPTLESKPAVVEQTKSIDQMK